MITLQKSIFRGASNLTVSVRMAANDEGTCTAEQ